MIPKFAHWRVCSCIGVFEIDQSIIRMSAEIVENIHSGELSATEILEAHIKRIEEINGELNAVVVPLFKEAREAAEEADRKFKEGISHSAK